MKTTISSLIRIALLLTCAGLSGGRASAQAVSIQESAPANVSFGASGAGPKTELDRPRTGAELRLSLPISLSAPLAPNPARPKPQLRVLAALPQLPVPAFTAPAIRLIAETPVPAGGLAEPVAGASVPRLEAATLGVGKATIGGENVVIHGPLSRSAARVRDLIRSTLKSLLGNGRLETGPADAAAAGLRSIPDPGPVNASPGKTRDPKRIVLFLDGTWDSKGRTNGGFEPTNVEKLSESLVDGSKQTSRYFDGVGTRPWEQISGGMFGWGIFEQIKEAYRFLVDNFEPGDKIFIFGFSRGAFAARSLAGMVLRCGVLKKEHKDAALKFPARPDELLLTQDEDLLKEDNADRMFAMYKHAYDPKNLPAVDEFKGRYSHDTGIRMLGVWDTVGALGIPTGVMPRALEGSLNADLFGFLDTALHPRVEAAYHAVAIDEHRGPFLPTLWTESAQGAARINVPGSDVEQVWFSGSHSNVGGGYGETALSDITLKWMADRAVAAGLETRGDFSPDPTGRRHDSLSAFLSMSPISRTGISGLDLLVARAAEWIRSTMRRRLAVDRDIPSGSSVHESVDARLGANLVAEPGGPAPYEPSESLRVVAKGPWVRTLAPLYRVAR